HDFQVRGVTLVNKDRIDDMKGQLARSDPVIISFHDSPGWHRHRGDATFTDLSFDPDEKKNGWHAMVLVGYDDPRQAFPLNHSWGTRWGGRGFGWAASHRPAPPPRARGRPHRANPEPPGGISPPDPATATGPASAACIARQGPAAAAAGTAGSGEGCAAS